MRILLLIKYHTIKLWNYLIRLSLVFCVYAMLIDRFIHLMNEIHDFKPWNLHKWQSLGLNLEKYVMFWYFCEKKGI